MGVDVKQSSFSGGYLSKALRARTDLVKYQQGLALCRNWIVKAQGGVVNRPGTKYVGWTRLSNQSTRQTNTFSLLVPFIYSADQSYVLELAYAKMRFVKDGAHVLDDTTIVTIDTPWAGEFLLRRLRWAQVNDMMWFTDGYHMPQILRRYSDTEWTLTPVDLSRPINPPTDVDDADGYTQPVHESGDYSHIGQEWEWVVTSVDADGRESLPSTAHNVLSALVYSDIKPYKIDWVAPVAANAPVRYNVYRGREGVYGYVGSSTELEFSDRGHAPSYADSPPSATNPFVDEKQQSELLDPMNALFSGVYAIKTEAEESYNKYYTYEYSVSLTGNNYNEVVLRFYTRPSGGGDWDLHATRTHNSLGNIGTRYYEFLITQDGQTADSEFWIETVSTEGTTAASRIQVTWFEARVDPDAQPTYPRAVAFLDQRIMFGGFSTNGQRIASSRVGDYHNFDTNIPTLADGPIDVTIASKRNDPILDLLSKSVLFAFTSGGEYIMSGQDRKQITPLSMSVKAHTSRGVANVAVLSVDDAALFVQRSGSKVMELVYDEFSENKILRDLTILAEDLFVGRQIVQWAYQEHPYGVVWAVTDDGKLFGLTYQREHQVFAWHEHETDGFVDSVCCVPEGAEDAVYLVVDRETKDGSDNSDRVIERMANRLEADPLEWIFLDSVASFDGSLDTNGSMTLTGGSTWKAGEELTLTASVASFVEGTDEGDLVVLTNWPTSSAFDPVRLLIREVTSTTVAIVEALDPIPSDVQAETTFYWSWGRQEFSGDAVEHFNDGNRVTPTGYEVSVIADGRILPSVTAVNHGTVPSPDWRVTISEPGVRVHIGLPYTSDLETLELSTQNQELRARTKTIKRVNIDVLSSKDLQVGQSFDKLEDARIREEPDAYGVTDPFTGLAEITARSSPRKSGGVCIRQESPQPAEIISLIPEVEVGD